MREDNGSNEETREQAGRDFLDGARGGSRCREGTNGGEIVEAAH